MSRDRRVTLGIIIDVLKHSEFRRRLGDVAVKTLDQGIERVDLVEGAAGHGGTIPHHDLADRRTPAGSLADRAGMAER